MNNLINKIYEYLKNNFSIKEFIINLFIIGIILFIGLYNFPYVIYKPGGIIELDGRIYVEGSPAELGSYNMAYVSVNRGNLPAIISSFLIKNWDLVKEDAITVANADYTTSLEIERMEMHNSINIAKLVAYQKADFETSKDNERNIIYAIDKNANTNLEPLDELVSVDNVEYENINDLRSYINTLNVGDKVIFKVINTNNKEVKKYAYIYEYEGLKLVGIAIYNTFDLETNPNIEIKTKNSEAGPSGGLMLTLAIYDSLIEDDLTHNKKIVGTGTINEDGTVGAIGGIKYKLLGAAKDKADVFFIPIDNYKEAKKVYDKYKLTFDLVMVQNIDDAISYLNSTN